MSAPRGMTWTAIAQKPDGTPVILGVCKDMYDLIYDIGDDDYFPEYSADWKNYWKSMTKEAASGHKKSLHRADGGEVFRVVKGIEVTVYSIHLTPNYHRW